MPQQRLLLLLLLLRHTAGNSMWLRAQGLLQCRLLPLGLHLSWLCR